MVNPAQDRIIDVAGHGGITEAMSARENVGEGELPPSPESYERRLLGL
jgi:hypothetical protein